MSAELAIGGAFLIVLMLFWLADLTSRSCRFEKTIIRIENVLNNSPESSQSEKAVVKALTVMYPKRKTPIATTKAKVQFVFGTESYFTTAKNVPRASLSEKSELKIPQGTVFEVRKPESSEVLFRMIIQNPNKMTAFETYTEYQTAPNTHPVWMNKKHFVSIYTAADPVKMCLHTGLAYQKVVGGIRLTDADGNPFIDTLEKDIDAYLIGPEVAVDDKSADKIEEAIIAPE